jgi:replicative DNA helicase
VPKAGQKTRDLSSAIPPNEKLLLSCLLLSADAREAIKEYVSRADLLHVLELRRIFEAVLALDADDVPFSVQAVASRLEPRLQRILTDLSFSELGISEEDAAYQAVHCLRALETKAVSAACNTLRQRIRELEERGEFTEALRLADELNRTKSASSGT